MRNLWENLLKPSWKNARSSLAHRSINVPELPVYFFPTLAQNRRRMRRNATTRNKLLMTSQCFACCKSKDHSPLPPFLSYAGSLAAALSQTPLASAVAPSLASKFVWLFISLDRSSNQPALVSIIASSWACQSFHSWRFDCERLTTGDFAF